MKINIKLTYEDLLIQQLYRSSRDNKYKSKKRNQTILLAIASIASAAYFFYTGMMVMVAYSCVLAILTVLFFPKYFNYRYKKFYEGHVMEKLSNRIGVKTAIQFTNEFIAVKDKTGEGKVKNDQVDFIANLPKQFLVNLKMGDMLVVSKDQINEDELKQKFNELGFVLIDESDWEWGKASKS